MPRALYWSLKRRFACGCYISGISCLLSAAYLLTKEGGAQPFRSGRRYRLPAIKGTTAINHNAVTGERGCHKSTTVRRAATRVTLHHLRPPPLVFLDIEFENKFIILASHSLVYVYFNEIRQQNILLLRHLRLPRFFGSKRALDSTLIAANPPLG